MNRSPFSIQALSFLFLLVASAAMAACSATRDAGLPSLSKTSHNVAILGNETVSPADVTASPVPTPSATLYNCPVCGCSGVSVRMLYDLAQIGAAAKIRRLDSSPAPGPTNTPTSGGNCNPTGPVSSPTPYIAAMEAAQAVQSVASPLPLVANRKALVRVYVVDAVSQSPGPIQITIGNAAPVTVTPPPGMGTILPKAVNESSLNYSYNIIVPASQIVPGLQINASLLDANKTPYNPASPLPVTVDTKMTLAIHAFSVILSHSSGNVGNITAGLANKVLFVPLATYANAGSLRLTQYDYANNEDEAEMLTKLGDKAKALNVTVGTYNVALGVFARPDEGDAGFAELGVPGLAYSFDGTFVDASIGTKTALAEAVATHEIGHSLGLNHAQTGVCPPPATLGNPEVPPPYLNRNGAINVEGYDLSGAQPILLPPSTKDFMGYCDPPSWASDLDWTTMAQNEPAAPAGGANARKRPETATQDSGLLLSIWGKLAPSLQITDSSTLNVAAPPSQLAPGSAYIQGLDAAGNTLFTTQTFGGAHMHDEQTTLLFNVTLPITEAQQQALHALKLYANGSTLTVVSKAIGPPIASARSIGAGNVQVSWNASMYPTIDIQTSDGTDSYFTDNGPVVTETIPTSDQSLRIGFSDGVKSVYETVPVAPCLTASCPALPTPSPKPSFTPSPAPTLLPTLQPSAVPSVAVPTASPPLVPASVGQQLSATVMSQDFYLVNGQEDLLPGGSLLPSLPNTVWKAVRIDTVIGVTPQSSAWLELGDTGGTFGTSAANQQWFGHYFAWHGTDGSYGAETAGDEYPSGVHEFHIGPNNDNWQILIDNAAVTDLTDPPLSLGLRSDAYLGNYNIANGSFTNGTSVSGLQYQDANGNYNFWSSTFPENFLYPTASATFDDGPFAVEFTHA